MNIKIFSLISLVLAVSISFLLCGGGDDSPSDIVPATGTNAGNGTGTNTGNSTGNYVDAWYGYVAYTGWVVEFNSDDLANTSKTVSSYEWDFNNDGTFEYTGPSSVSTFTYSSVATQVAKLKINYNDSTTDFYKFNVDVKDNATGDTRRVVHLEGAEVG